MNWKRLKTLYPRCYDVLKPLNENSGLKGFELFKEFAYLYKIKFVNYAEVIHILEKIEIILANKAHRTFCEKMPELRFIDGDFR